MEPEGPESKVPDDGPADYLFKTPKYQDCVLTVGDPITDIVEKIGVSVRHLAAHSSVFREMLVDSDLADPTGNNTHIIDIRPEVFKLMLTFVYGGQMPTMSRDTTTELLTCADKYNITQLVSFTCRLLKPNNLGELFPVLRYVAYMTLPKLDRMVQKLVQEHTNEIVNHKEFLNLDENCLVYIAKQDTLAITEVELWNALLKWGLKKGPNSQLRQFLRRPLKYLRILTLTQGEFLREVLSKNVLSPEEELNVLKAIVNNDSFESADFCISKIKRTLGSENKAVTISVESEDQFVGASGTFVLNTDFWQDTSPVAKVRLEESQRQSSFTLTVGDCDIELLYLTCMTKSNAKDYSQKYFLYCTISVYRLNNIFFVEQFNISQVEGNVLFEEKLEIPLKVQTHSKECPLFLKANTSYSIQVKFEDAHPVYGHNTRDWIDGDRDITYVERHCPHFKLKFKSPPHVLSISYKV